MSHVNFTLSLNDTSDTDIVEWLSKQPNKNAAIKQSIRTSMKEEPDMKVLEYFTQMREYLDRQFERLQSVRVEAPKESIAPATTEHKPIPKNVKSAILSGFKPTKKLEETDNGV